MRILVTGNCQTGGLAATFARLLPGAEIEAHALGDFLSGERDQPAEIAGFDHWVSTEGFHLMDALKARFPASGVQLIKCPILWFSAFHPDMTYLWDTREEQHVWPHYNSRIAAWAFMHGVEARDATRLFTREAYRGLGYLQVWDSDVAQLRKHFGDCGADFDAFFLDVKRQGVFMHTLNHPRPQTLVSLGKVLARRMGADAETLNKPITIPDGLQGVIWPIYPEIADHYSLPGSYEWFAGGPIAGSLLGFIETYYRFYEELKLDRERIHYSTRRTSVDMDPQYTAILEPLLKRSS